MSDKASFVPRSHCPRGHDLHKHGFSYNGAIHCKLCRAALGLKQTKLGKKRTADGTRFARG